MLREVLRLLGVDLDHKLAQIRAQLEEFKARTTHQLTEQVKATGLMVGFAFVGAVAAIATFVIVLVALYRVGGHVQRAIRGSRCSGRGDGIIGDCHVHARFRAQTT